MGFFALFRPFSSLPKFASMDLASRVQHLESLYGYETRKSLGAGSFGTVLHAVRVDNPDNNAAVAVKM